MPACALATVLSSRKEPICMMKATSPAAKISPMMTEAINARETSRSALMSNRVYRPTAASLRMGIPHSTMATQAASIRIVPESARLTSREIPERTRRRIFRKFSCFIQVSHCDGIAATPYILMNRQFFNIRMGVWVCKRETEKTGKILERRVRICWRSGPGLWRIRRWSCRRRHVRCRRGRSGADGLRG